MAKKPTNKKQSEQFTLSELYRQLRTNIEFSQVDSALKVINIISTHPNEGKSTVASNLAQIYADKYRRVLLIDCDLRNPSLHKHLGTSNAFGLTNLLLKYRPEMVLSEQEEVQVLQQESGHPLYFLSTGNKVLNPTELLSSKRFGTFIASAREQFDAVIVDCPPAFLFSDAVPISNVCDGTLLVLSAKETNKNDAREVVQDLQRNGANLVGTVLTKVPDFHAKHGSYGYGYWYGYGRDSHE